MMASLPLLPDSAPKLIGIARLAAEGESLRQGHEVEYFTLPIRSLLNRCTGSRMPFTWTINPYRGCEFACKYCYARYTHEFMEMRDGVAFEQKIFVKQHAADLLRQELRQVKSGEEIAIGTATDPYQPAERRFEVTRAILEEFSRHKGFEIGIVTKSNLILRDVEFLQQVARSNKLFVNLTITTLNADLSRIIEPRAPRPDLRIRAVARLRQEGLRAGVMCSPLMPGITDSRRSISEVARAAAAADASFFTAGALFLKPCSLPTFLASIREHFPSLLASYERRYSRSAFVSAKYRRHVTDLVESVRREYKLGQRHTWEDPTSVTEQESSAVALQPWLPFAS